MVRAERMRRAGQGHAEVEGVQPGVEGAVVAQHQRAPGPARYMKAMAISNFHTRSLDRLELADGGELAQEGEAQGHGDELDGLLGTQWS